MYCTKNFADVLFIQTQAWDCKACIRCSYCKYFAIASAIRSRIIFVRICYLFKFRSELGKWL